MHAQIFIFKHETQRISSKFVTVCRKPLSKFDQKQLESCDVSFDAEGNASDTVGSERSANQFLMQYHPHQKAPPL